MNTTINTNVSGQYTLTVQRNGSTVTNLVIPNAITDRGMQRLAGHFMPSTSVPYSGVASNLSYIYIGRGDVPNPIPTNQFKLVTPYYNTIGTGNFASYANDASLTKTTWFADKVVFTKGQKIVLGSTFITNTITEIGCGTFDATSTGAGDLTDTPERALFSYAKVDPVINIQANDTLLLRYDLTISWTPELSAITTLQFDNAPGEPTTLPNSKTNIRRKPFYDLLPNGTIAAPTLPMNGSSWAAQANLTVCAPLELFNPTGNATTNYPYPNLHFYDNTNVTYANMTSTTFTNAASSNNAQIVNTTTDLAGYDAEISLYGVKNIIENSGNTYKKVYRFLIYPGQWPHTASSISGDRYSWVFWRGSNTTQLLNNPSDTGRHGILTCLQDKYVPNPEHYIGIDYTFAVTR